MWKKLVGIIGGKLQFGFGWAILKGISATALAVRNSLDTVYANLFVARADIAQPAHATAFLDLQERVILIEFSFDGAAAPAPGMNTGKYGFCHTTGGGSTAGKVYYDTGAALTEVAIYKMQEIASTSAVVGTVSLIANGIYVAQTAAAPFTWTLKGDGAPSSTGYQQVVQISVSNAPGNFDSTTSIPAGATVMRVDTIIDTAFNGVGATLLTKLNGGGGVTLQATTDNDPTTTGTYENDPFQLAGAFAGVIRVTLGGAGGATGAARVLVFYSTPGA